MTVFHIPSWFPSSEQPFAGIFNKDYIHNYAETNPDSFHIVSTYASNNYYINPSTKIGALKAFLKDDSKGFKTVKISDNLEYYTTPKTISFPSRLGYNALRHLYNINKRNLEKAIRIHKKVDVIHAYVTFPGGQIANRLSEEFDIPFIITEHFGPFPQPGLLKNGKLVKSMYQPLKNAKKVIAVSNHLLEMISRHGDFDLQLVPNIVNEELFVINNETKHDGGRDFTFYTQCLINGHRKGLEILLKSAKILQNKGYNAKFRIGGTGTEHDYYIKMAKKLGVDVTWLGKLSYEDLIKEYNACSCFVLTSLHENFGIVYAEANACGKPIIATDSGGPSDIVSKTNGLLIPMKNVDATVEAMIYMIENIDRYDPVKIREEFLEKFSKKAVLGKYNEIYRSLLK